MITTIDWSESLNQCCYLPNKPGSCCVLTCFAFYKAKQRQALCTSVITDEKLLPHSVGLNQFIRLYLALALGARKHLAVGSCRQVE